MTRLREAPDLLNAEIKEAEQDINALAKGLSQLLTSKADKKAVADLKTMAGKLSASLSAVTSQLKDIERSLKDNRSGEEISALKARLESLKTELAGADTAMVDTLRQRISQVEKATNASDPQINSLSDDARQLKDAIKKLQEAVKTLEEHPPTYIGGGGISASGTPAENEYARFTKRRRLEGRTAAQTRGDLDLEGGTDFPSLTTFNDHSARHEDAGADELSIQGLAGTPAALTTHEAALDPHTGYRLESADHSHQTTGAQAGQLDHGLALTGLTDDDHTQYIKHSLATALSDFLVASGVGAFVKKTLAEVKTILGLGSAAYTASTDYEAAGGITTHAALTTGIHGVGIGTVAKVGDIATDGNLSAAAQAAVTASHSVNDTGTHGTATTGVHGVGAGTVAKTADIAATKIDDLTAGDDNTDLDSNTTRHGLLVKAVAPGASLLNVPGIVNGETVFTNKPVFDATNPAALGTAAPGTAVVAAHRDHVHANPAIDTLAAATDITTLDVSTSAHGLTPKAVAPAANVLNVLSIANGETAITNKAIFDGTNPAALGTAAPGTSLIAAHRDHVHANPALDTLAAPTDITTLNATTSLHGLVVKCTAPAASTLNVVGIVNGETAYTNKTLFDATNPAALGAVAPGTAVVAAHRDHVHANPAIDTLAAATDITTLDTSTTAHGLAPKVVAPAAGLLSVMGVANGETALTNKALFDTTNPAALGTAAPGTTVIAARRDHVHLDPVVAHAAAANPHTVYLLKQMAENDPILLDAAISGDGYYSGICEAGTAGAALAFGDLVYLAVADSRWELADADAAATAGPVKLGICVLAAVGDGSATTILLFGKVNAATAFPALTIGAPAYVSTTAGDIQVAAPSGASDIVRIVGYANTADELFFCPDCSWVEL